MCQDESESMGKDGALRFSKSNDLEITDLHIPYPWPQQFLLLFASLCNHSMNNSVGKHVAMNGGFSQAITVLFN